MRNKKRSVTIWFALLFGTCLWLPILCHCQLYTAYDSAVPNTPEKAADEVKRINALPIPPTQYEVEQEYTDARHSVQACDAIIQNIDANIPKLPDAKQFTGDTNTLLAVIMVFSNDLQRAINAYNAANNLTGSDSSNQSRQSNDTNTTSVTTNSASKEATPNTLKGVAGQASSPEDIKLNDDIKHINDQFHLDKLTSLQYLSYDPDTGQSDISDFIVSLKNLGYDVQTPSVSYSTISDMFYRCFPQDNPLSIYMKVPVAIGNLSEKLATRRSNAVDIKLAWSKRCGDCSTALQKYQAGTAKTVADNLPWLMLVLAAFGAVVILLVKSFGENIQMEWVASGQVIQLLTVVTLLLIILCLALSDIIKEDTVGTLLGGIGGYVLSQGIGRAAGRAATRAVDQSNDTRATGADPAKPK